MAITFETLMELPFLRGASKADISEFLGSIPVAFKTYQPGETIVNPHDRCDSLLYVMSGNVLLTYEEVASGISIRETLRHGRTIGAGHLYGLSPEYGVTAIALSVVGIMSLAKEQFMRMLRGNQVYWLNFVNYLSARTQRIHDSVRIYSGAGLTRQLAMLVGVYTEPEATDIEIVCTRGSLKEFAGIDDVTLDDTLADLRMLGVISGEHWPIAITSRGMLLVVAKGGINATDMRRHLKEYKEESEK